MPGRRVMINDVYCDSCLSVIPAGTRARVIRPPKPKARNRRHAMLIGRGVITGRPQYRHIGCPIPDEQVRCPFCKRPAGQPCAFPVYGPDGTVIDYGRDTRRPHTSRTRIAKERTRS